ncbi:MAG: putative transport system permease protein [Actinomycetota bacterium]|jgi:putative ABC transport system permease protein
MTGFVALHLRRLREHPGRSAMSAGGIAVGVALMVAMLGLFGSFTSGAQRVTDLSGGANVEVSAPNDGGIDESLVDEVSHVSGVKAAAPLIRSQVSLRQEPTLLLGFDKRARSLGQNAVLAECRPKQLPQRPGIIVGPSIARSRTVAITSSTGTVPIEVLARADCGPAKKVNAGRFVMAPLALAEQLAGRPHRIDTIEVVAQRGTRLSRLTDAVDRVVAGRAIVASPKLLADQARTNTEAFQQGGRIMVVMAMVVGGFCVFNTVSMTALERRRELATLRAVGGPRRRLLLGFLVEITLLGVIGSALGAALGFALGSRLVSAIPAVFVDQVGVRPSFDVPGTLIAGAMVLGTLVTIGAAILPARAAVRVPPVEAMRPEGPAESSGAGATRSTVATVVGVVVLVGGTVVTAAGSKNATVVGFGTITVGMVLATYGIRDSVARAAAVFAAMFGSSGRLAGASVERAPRRTWATVTAVTVAVGTIVTMGGVVDNQIFTYKRPFESMKRPDVWIGTAPTKNIPVNLRFDDGFTDRLKTRVPWIGEVIGTQSAYTTVGRDRILVQGFDRGTAAPVFANTSPHNREALFEVRHPAIVVNTQFAETNHLHVGDGVDVRTARGPMKFRILEVVNVPSPSQTGTFGMDRRWFERAFGRTGFNFVEAYGKHGINRTQLKRLIDAAVTDSPTRAYTATGDVQYDGVVSSLKQTTGIFQAMQVAVLLATVLALANAMLISVVERRREIGIVRAVGMSRRQLRRMVLVESLAITAVGCVIGVLLGLLQHRVGDRAVGALVKSAIDYRFVASPTVLGLVAMAATAIVAALLPARRAGNVNVIEAIGYE